MSEEFRVVWKREGQARRRKIYQSRGPAEDFADMLRKTARDEPPLGYGGENRYPDEQWDRMSAPFIEGPTIESRPVGIWSGVVGSWWPGPGGA